MALVNKRITELPERSALNLDDFTVVDGDTGGTAKFNLANMDGDISDLKTAINNKIVVKKHLLGFTEGEYVNGYINSSGTISSGTNVNFRSTDFIPVVAGDKLTYNLLGYQTSLWIITAYDSNKERIADASVIGAATVKNGVYTVSEGTAFIRISGHATASAGFFSDTIMYGYQSTERAITAATDNPFGIAVYDLYSGYLNTSGGRTGASATAKEVVTSVLPVTPGVTVFDIYCNFSTVVNQWLAIGYYTSEFAFISREVIDTGTAAETRHYTKSIAETNAAYVVFSWRTYGEDAVTIKFTPNRVYNDTIHINDNAGTGDTDVVWSADKTYSEINTIGSGIDGKINEVMLSENPGYININGTIAAQNATNKEVYTDELSVKEGDTVKVALEYSASNVMWAAYGLYDNSGAFISREVAINSIIQKAGDCTITVPSGAYRLRLTYRTYGTHTIKITTTGKTRNVSALLEENPSGLINGARFPFVLGCLINAAYTSGNDSWNMASKAYCSVMELQYTKEALPICLGKDYQIEVQTRTSEGVLVSRSGWLSTSLTIPADTYYTLTVRKMSGADITVDEAINNVFPGTFVDNELSVTYNKIAQRIVNLEIGYISSISNVKSVNHRGYNYYAPENTLPAFKLSREKGFVYVECDVEYTSDGVPVILHDSTINRTARNVDGTEISGDVYIYNITYEQALTYDFGIYKGTAFAGTKIPTLKQFIELCRDCGMHPYIELKSAGSTQALIERCAEIVRDAGMSNKVTWISFSDTCLGYIKNVEPSARLGLVVSSVTSNLITTAEGLKTTLNEVFIDSGSYTSEEIELCKGANFPMEVWTVDNPVAVRNLDRYISGVTSNCVNAGYDLYKQQIVF